MKLAFYTVQIAIVAPGTDPAYPGGLWETEPCFEGLSFDAASRAAIALRKKHKREYRVINHSIKVA